jgi:hypothetical protein
MIDYMKLKEDEFQDFIFCKTDLHLISHSSFISALIRYFNHKWNESSWTEKILFIPIKRSHYNLEEVIINKLSLTQLDALWNKGCKVKFKKSDCFVKAYMMRKFSV